MGLSFRSVIAAIAAFVALPALGFHSGGVGACSGCHETHPTQATGPSLLRVDNPTDLCLQCHETGNGNSWGTHPLSPGPLYGGGQFVFLLEDNLNDGPGGNDPLNWIPGHQAGHNVVSIAHGTDADPDFLMSPGGSYPSSNLHCTSCHDPHGRGGHFRLLYGDDFPEAQVNGEVFTYTRPAPEAVGIALDGPEESDVNHTAYLSGTSEWCSNCHALYHDGSGTGLEHPSGEILDSDIIDMYDNYRGTGFLDGDGTQAYLATVPIEFPGSTTTFRGPTPMTARVTCLSCHRAHASSGPRSGRWDFNIATWVEEGVLSGSYAIPNPYDATAGPAQGRLCEKCHGQNVPE